ncbi:uncharacterized protein FOMMEDRAFT_149578 [Fomitiporia mediterranea MF3/22]|uniref:PX domain-containing protein n=1 Tax=Fomitiporia mediterranea (strain MF3/22) TaxID=694068 RepID=R7SGE8_FOMME|nr:uncharacterized protein FOMMEDRAFT_149578 [Fomitiporia mediterranea MF3/22]EJC97781.1 hypothetical protein FOMMEDRAFT_149578 [Fomitiporia mediterranea MF3/22]
MSTFPRRLKQSGGPTISAGAPAQPLLTRPATSDFDAGLNSSAAWTEHLDLARTLSESELAHVVPVGEADSLSLGSADEEKVVRDDDDGEQQDESQEGVELTLTRGRPARVLYDFNGEATAKELSVRAGDELEVLHETIDSADGWSLARIPLRVHDDDDNDDNERNEQDADDADSEHGGEVGLVPREYYTFTTDFISSPEDALADTNAPGHTQDASTPRASIVNNNIDNNSKSSNPPLIPQNTGEWFRQQVRRSLLGGRSFNRFSRFVTSGAEAFILRGGPPANSIQARAEDGLPPSDATSANFRPSSYLPHVGHLREPSAVPPETDNKVHFIDVDEAGPIWRSKVPPFDVRVHSPEKRYPHVHAGEGENGGEEGRSVAGAYIVYSVTSTFSLPLNSAPSSDDEDEETDTRAVTTNATIAQPITVHRRFSHFVLLHNAISAQLPGLALPALPEKQYAGRLSSAFVEARRAALQRYLRALVRHPVVRYSEALTFFLSCEDEVEWRRQLPYHLHTRPAGASFYSNVFHLPFQVDAEEVTETAERFENHTRAVSQGVQQLRGMYGRVKSARLEMSNAERQLSYALLSLITSKPLTGSLSLSDSDDSDSSASPSDNEIEANSTAHSPINTINATNGRHRRHHKQQKRNKRGLQNAEGAWCWREDCTDCLRLTKCIQKTAETLQGVADLYDGHARRTMLETEDSLKDAAHPDKTYSPILDIHRETLLRYKEESESELTRSPINSNSDSSNAQSNDDWKDTDDGKTIDKKGTKEEEENTAQARCETVLNTTLAEMDEYHSTKRDTFEQITKMHLDNEIAFYEQLLTRLHTTRALFSAPSSELELTMPGPRVMSVYERELGEMRVAEPLTAPAPHVLDGTGMRPVSKAIQGLLGLTTGSGLGVGQGMSVNDGGDGEGRGSVFGRLW